MLRQFLFGLLVVALTGGFVMPPAAAAAGGVDCEQEGPRQGVE
jgi:hypothetical protein